MMKYVISEHFFVEQSETPWMEAGITVDEKATQKAREYRTNAELESKTLTIDDSGKRKWLCHFKADIGSGEKEVEDFKEVHVPHDAPCVVCKASTETWSDEEDLLICQRCQRRALVWVCKKAREEL